MIEELHIRDLGVIEEAEVPLGRGFTAITGETGAGKTMVVQALGLLMGARADAGAVRSGAERTRVTGIIRTDDRALAEAVDDAGGEVTDGELVLSRVVSSEGRSRASVGGTPTPVGTLAQLADHLFVVHGQSEQLRLRTQAAQRETLDRFGGPEHAALLSLVERTFDEHRRAHGELETLQSAQRQRLREADRLRSELEEIEQIAPQPEEDEQLSSRIERLGNIEELRAAATAARAAFSAETDDPFARDAMSLIADATQALERVAGADSELADLYQRTASIAVQVQETASDLASYASSLDEEGPEELARASDRMGQIISLTRKYGPTVAEVLEYSERAGKRLSELDRDDVRIDELTSAVAELQTRVSQLTDELSERRTAVAATLGERVTEELRALALPEAEFSVRVTPTAPSRFGADSVDMLLAPHPGATARPIAKGASGGELSRVMLALEVVVAGVDHVPTFVFDEVDAGVGGSAAIEIGRRLATLAETSQVIVVTHLAQVAAFATNHLQVVKDSAGGFTKSSCRVLTGDERLAEMARLLSGLDDSTSAREHAAELLALRDA